MSGDESLMKARDVAELLGLDVKTVVEHFQRGDLPGYRLYGRKGGPLRFRRSEIEAWSFAHARLARGGRAPEVTPLAWENVLQVAGEIDRRFEHVPVLAAGTGLRPEEWLALERRDIDLEGRVIHVRRVFSSGWVTELGADGAKTYPAAPPRPACARP